MADESGTHLNVQVLEHGKLIKFIDVFAGGNWTILKAEGERLYACGLNNYGQLGIEPPQQENAANGASGSQMETGDDVSYTILRPRHIAQFDLIDSKWTHISGVFHLAFRNDKGLNFNFF